MKEIDIPEETNGLDHYRKTEHHSSEDAGSSRDMRIAFLEEGNTTLLSPRPYVLA